MIPWIQVYSNLAGHRKTGILADELKIQSPYVSPGVIAVGILVSLWTWAIQNAPDGDLSKCSPRAIAEACRWKKKPETLTDALRKAGFIDPDGRLHDWEEYTILYTEKEDRKKEKTRERVREYRRRKGQEVEPDVTRTKALQGHYGNAFVRECNVPTIPYHTIPIPSLSINQSISRAGAREDTDSQTEIVENSVENPVENSLADELSTDDDDKRVIMDGIGEGVVFLSRRQQRALLERLSLEEYQHYVNVIAEAELSGKHFRKTHYQAMLDMAKEDRKL